MTNVFDNLIRDVCVSNHIYQGCSGGKAREFPAAGGRSFPGGTWEAAAGGGTWEEEEEGEEEEEAMVVGLGAV